MWVGILVGGEGWQQRPEMVPATRSLSSAWSEYRKLMGCMTSDKDSGFEFVSKKKG